MKKNNEAVGRSTNDIKKMIISAMLYSLENCADWRKKKLRRTAEDTG